MARRRVLDSRPIRRIPEAKGRKKLRAAQRPKKARKKAEGVNATRADMSEREEAHVRVTGCKGPENDPLIERPLQ